MFNTTTFSQAIAQVVHYDSWFFEHQQEKHWEPSPTLRSPPMLQPKHVVSTPNDDPMQISKTWFKPLTNENKQRWHVNNLYLYYAELGRIASACPKKCVQHVTFATTSTTTKGLKKKGNKDV
jgi:hypothetical protein